MTPIGYCVICKHRIKGNICEAFPNGIPAEILSWKFDHTRKHPDQTNDIVFESVLDVD